MVFNIDDIEHVLSDNLGVRARLQRRAPDALRLVYGMERPELFSVGTDRPPVAAIVIAALGIDPETRYHGRVNLRWPSMIAPTVHSAHVGLILISVNVLERNALVRMEPWHDSTPGQSAALL